MLKKIIGALLLLSLVDGEYTANSQVQLSAPSDKVLSDIIEVIVRHDWNAAYFSKVNPKNIKLSHQMNVSGVNGNVVRWEYMQGVRWSTVKNRKTGVAARYEVVDNDGIIFEIFLSDKYGDSKIPRVETIELSKEPQIFLGYHIETINGIDLDLKKEISQILNVHLEEIKKKIANKSIEDLFPKRIKEEEP